MTKGRTTMRAKTGGLAGIKALCLAAILAGSALGAAAQDLFSPVITVNGAAITGFEIDQRIRLLEVFRSSGDLAKIARTQLVEDKLKQALLTRDGLVITDAALATAMEDFASRADLTLAQMVTLLEQNGVAAETLRDYVRAGVTWRDYVRVRFGDRVTITPADIDQALGQTVPQIGGIEVLLTEIIIAAPPPRAAEAMAIAQRIAGMTTTGAFEAAARAYSALPSREVGGRLGWLPIANYPAQLRPLLLALAPGQVTAPLPIDGGIALFQMRDVREVAVATPPATRLGYMVYAVPGGIAAAQAVAARVDVCNDLYGEAFGQPPEVLQVLDQAPDELAPDVALALARLDPDEASTGLSRNGGATGLVVMLCSRTTAVAGDSAGAGAGAGAEAGTTAAPVDRDAVAARLRNQRLAGYAEVLLAEQRAAAEIIGE